MSAPRPYVSWIARYWSTNGLTLCGGVLRSQSSRWASRNDALLFLEITEENNGPHCAGEVVGSHKYPEIFSHCKGAPAQAIGGKCRCGRVLTIQDGKEYVKRALA